MAKNPLSRTGNTLETNKPRPFSERQFESVQAAFTQAISAYPLEIDRRKLEQHSVKVLPVKTGGSAPAMPGGSILIITGDPKDKNFRSIVKAAESGDAAQVSKAMAKFEASLSRRPSAHLAIPVDPIVQLARIPLLGQVVYRGKVLADAMVVGEGHGLSIARIPWAGGRLDPEGFRANYFFRGEDRQPAETVVITREPKLSGVELKVLEKLPAELSQEAFGSPGDVANWGLAAAAAVFVFVVVAGVYLAREAQRQMQEQQRQNEQEMQHQFDNQAQQQDQAAVQQDQGQQQQQDQAQQQQDQGQQQQQDQAQQQQDQGQQQQDQGQQQQQDQGQQDQGQQDQGGQDKQNESGDLTRFIDEASLAVELEGLDARAAVATLLQLRGQLIAQGRIG